VWPNKVEYDLEIPVKAVAFGTQATIQMKFTPLLKGLKIGEIVCTLVEQHKWNLLMSTQKKDRNIRDWKIQVNDEVHYRDVLNEHGQEGWFIEEKLQLPTTLKECVQDVDDGEKISITHKVKVVVALINPDGHVSEVNSIAPAPRDI
jgi:hypothetical protein